jgi:hypothetical protein
MPNMSYCRFTNTLSDLRDCQEAMGDTEPGEMSSHDERVARWSLVRLCQQIADEFGHEADEERPQRERAR